MHYIKSILREELGKLDEFIHGNHKADAHRPSGQKVRDPRLANDDDPKKDNDLNRKQGEGGKKEYSDVRRAFDKLGGPSMVDIMKILGVEDDAKGTNRSLFRKKVKQIKNKETGSYYQFSDEELTDVRTALNIKK